MGNDGCGGWRYASRILLGGGWRGGVFYLSRSRKLPPINERNSRSCSNSVQSLGSTEPDPDLLGGNESATTVALNEASWTCLPKHEHYPSKYGPLSSKMTIFSKAPRNLHKIKPTSVLNPIALVNSASYTSGRLDFDFHRYRWNESPAAGIRNEF